RAALQAPLSGRRADPAGAVIAPGQCDGSEARTRRREPSAPAGRWGMAADPRRRARRPGPLDLAFLAVIVAFALWASITTVLTDRPLVEARVYLAVPAVLAGSVLLGRLAAHGADARSAAVRAATVLLCPAGLCLLAAGILDSSLYANAQAAAGVQIVALAALLLTSTLRR